MKILWFQILVSIAIAGCSGNRKTISERPLVEATRGDDAVPGNVRDIEQNKPAREFYVKNKDLKVKPVRKLNSNGSLTSVEDARSYVLPTTLPIAVGSVLDIKMTSNRLDTAPLTPGGEAPKVDDKSQAQLEQELLKALPNLDPGATAVDKPTLVKSFKSQVIDIRDNGDVVVAYHRRSIRADQAADLLIKAVVPYEALTDRDNITTAKLEDIQLRESQDGDLIERMSSNWEDEYTLRMSGFDEAKSKSALALEDQRNQIKEAKGKVVAQIKSLGNERNTMAKERQGLLDAKKKDDEKIKSLEEQIKERDAEIEKLKPKEDEEAMNLTDEEKELQKEKDAENEVSDPKAKPKLDAKADNNPAVGKLDPKDKKADAAAKTENAQVAKSDAKKPAGETKK